MRLTITIFVFLMVRVASCIHAETSNPTAKTSDPVARKLFIDPSSTSVALGKASLIVSPLTHRGGNYVGDYQLKVRPYFFRVRKALYSWRHPMIRFGSSRPEQRSTLPARPSRAKTAKLMSCLGRQHRHQVTGGASHFQL
jgi:hypothetical protein